MPALFTPEDHSGWGIVSLADTASARRSAFLLRRRVAPQRMPDLWQRLTHTLWVAEEHDSARGLWLHRARAS